MEWCRGRRVRYLEHANCSKSVIGGERVAYTGRHTIFLSSVKINRHFSTLIIIINTDIWDCRHTLSIYKIIAPFPFLLGRQAWDLAVDICLSQLPEVIENPGNFKVFGSHEKCYLTC